MKRDDWRPSRYGLDHDLRTVKLATIRSISKLESLALVHILHDWLNENSDAGYLPELSLEVLAREIFAMDLQGIFEDMGKVGFLEKDGDRFRLPREEWDFYHDFLESRKTTRQHWREASKKYRKKNKGNDSVIHDVSMMSAPYRIEENSIEENDRRSDGDFLEPPSSGEKIKIDLPQGVPPVGEVDFVDDGKRPVTDLGILQDLWNEIMPKMASRFGIGRTKRKQCLDTARIARLTLAEWRELFVRMATNDFILNKEPKTSLEWFLSDPDHLCGLDNNRWDPGKKYVGGNSRPPRMPDAEALALKKLHKDRQEAARGR
ncbi:MAG: hypothetical protein A3G34_07955 [Candidatus Lindowbacteria bacterium RIFCSPLOWO2_12_FULL_62_27]|nr:MAG: hypothetical protein A3G34_07955 [Candidatus Lindowbacteria bacterium RIFCSPLOWO2_12_FULL_62_27]OGH63588.1 MAG: hypothetical protein A3I06_13975 [Candidatus Lindowbacteria bacterium RIFCSPLOWO2_02_FULL_62_12]